jgi:hypothetical protein
MCHVDKIKPSDAQVWSCKPQFQKVHWNVIRIMYDSGNAFVKMVNKEWTCLLHRTQSFNKHTEQLITLELQKWHKALCFKYKNATSLEEVDVWYATIWSWWYSSRAIPESVIHELNN